jgi:hypothetical protein
MDENKYKELISERDLMNDELQAMKEDIKNQQEENPETYNEIMGLIERLKKLFNETDEFYRYMSYHPMYKEIKASFDRVKKEKNYDFFSELDYAINDGRILPIERIYEILNINKKEFEDELKINPVRLLSIIRRRSEDLKSDEQKNMYNALSYNIPDVKNIIKKYRIKPDEVFNKIISDKFKRLRDAIPEDLRIKEIQDIIAIESLFTTVVSGALKMSVYDQCAMDGENYVIRGIDGILSDITHEIAENSKRAGEARTAFIEAQKRLETKMREEEALDKEIEIKERLLKTKEKEIEELNQIRNDTINRQQALPVLNQDLPVYTNATGENNETNMDEPQN